MATTLVPGVPVPALLLLGPRGAHRRSPHPGMLALVATRAARLFGHAYRAGEAAYLVPLAGTALELLEWLFPPAAYVPYTDGVFTYHVPREGLGPGPWCGLTARALRRVARPARPEEQARATLGHLPDGLPLWQVEVVPLFREAPWP